MQSESERRAQFDLVREQLDDLDYYAVLGVAKSASAEQIRDAFHEFALLFHPDRYVDDEATQRQALHVFKRGSEAYRVLTNTVLRARFDQARARGALRLSADEMFAGVDSASGAVAEIPLPPAAQALFDKATQALERGDINNAKMHLMLARAKASSPRFDVLQARIDEATSRKR
ncbi:MAG: DnaJ domain-containing protein [Polyangiales bacterium]